MEQTTVGTENTAPVRPAFIKVLCILSFIGTGIGLLSGLFNYWSNHQMAEGGGAVMNALGAMQGGDQATDAMNKMASALGIDYAKQAMSSLIVGLLNIVVFLGAIMMWNLKKIGFYIYTLGQVVSITVPFVIVGGLLGGISGMMMALFAIAFIIMYAVNLKHMH
jgi:hypothetical protein